MNARRVEFLNNRIQPGAVQAIESYLGLLVPPVSALW
jgi:hypothetical protein